MIPAILVATVMVAGIFAFMPVEQASTVHDTIIASTTDIRQIQQTIVFDATAAVDNDLIRISSAEPFEILSIIFDASTNLAGVGDAFGIDDVFLNGKTTTAGAIAEADPTVLDDREILDALGQPDTFASQFDLLIDDDADGNVIDTGDELDITIIVIADPTATFTIVQVPAV